MKTYIIAAFLLTCFFGKNFYAMDTKIEFDTLKTLNQQMAKKYIEAGSVEIPYLEQIIDTPEIQEILKNAKFDLQLFIELLKEHKVDMGTIQTDVQGMYAFLEQLNLDELDRVQMNKMVIKSMVLGLLLGSSAIDLVYNGPSLFNISIFTLLSVLMVVDIPHHIGFVKKSWNNIKKLGSAFIAYSKTQAEEMYHTKSQ